MARGYSQKDRLLRIDTILNSDPEESPFRGDPLLLVKLDGVEGISRLFAYDVIMLRDAGGLGGEKIHGERRPHFDTTRLIGTHVEIGARPGAPDRVHLPGEGNKEREEEETIFVRVGMFEAFEDILSLGGLRRKLVKSIH